jgi:hypothetical protein
MDNVHAKMQALIDEGAKGKVEQLRHQFAEMCAGKSEKEKERALGLIAQIEWGSLTAFGDIPTMNAAISLLNEAVAYHKAVYLLLHDEGE